MYGDRLGKGFKVKRHFQVERNNANMRVLVTGVKGQLGHDVVKWDGKTRSDSDQVDLCGDGYYR